MALDMTPPTPSPDFVAEWVRYLRGFKGQPHLRIEVECQAAAQALLADIAEGRLPAHKTALDVAGAAEYAGLPNAADFVFPLFGLDPPPRKPRADYVDNGRDAGQLAAQQREPRIIAPRGFVWRDPKTIPPRAFIMGSHFIRRYVGATIAPGGLGKSALLTAEALALVTGRMLLGAAPRTPKRVWYLGEDDQEELDRRFLAAMKFYGIKPDDIGGRLFVQSFRDTRLVIAEQFSGGVQVNIADIEALVMALKAAGIDVLIIDPLVKTHRVPENDNGAMEALLTAWVEIAERANCAVELVVHSRKSVAGQAKSIEDWRGGSAQLGAVRDARLVVRMTEEEAVTMGIEPEQTFRHIRIGDTKANMTPHPDSIRWLKLASVSLENATEAEDADNPNADNVQVVTEFKAPTLFEGVPWEAIDTVMRALSRRPYRLSPQASDWAGHIVGANLDINTEEKSGKARVMKMINAWVKSGALEIEQHLDERRKPRDCIVLGNWVFNNHQRAEDDA